MTPFEKALLEETLGLLLKMGKAATETAKGYKKDRERADLRLRQCLGAYNQLADPKFDGQVETILEAHDIKANELTYYEAGHRR